MTTIHDQAFLANRIYFVLNGLLNGEEGVQAIPAGGGDDDPQLDGWYYFQKDGEADGVGPYDSRDAAERAAKEFDDESNDIQQKIMDAAYDRWQKNTEWSKAEFLAQLSPRERFAVMTGNLNYQVCNGGWSQWGPCNEYGTLSTVRSIRADLVRFTREKPAAFPASLRVLVLLQEYEARTEFDGDAPTYPKDDEDDSDADYDNIYAGMDTQFYDINDAWLLELRTMLNNWKDA